MEKMAAIGWLTEERASPELSFPGRKAQLLPATAIAAGTIRSADIADIWRDMKAPLFIPALALLIAALLSAPAAHGQFTDDEGEGVRATEMGFLAGGSLYYGDLAASQRSYLKETTPHVGVLLRSFLGRNASLRGNFCVARLEGNDGWYKTPEWRQHRNFYFKTVLIEASLLFEYDLLRGRRLEKNTGFGAYLFAGFGACFTNPQRNFNNVDPGYFAPDDPAVSGYQADFSRDAKHLALVLPVGIGLRQRIGKRTSVFAEGSMRQGLDDRIDGFSSSVNSGKFDAYAFASLGLVVRMKGR
jgi:hypothetical protein